MTSVWAYAAVLGVVTLIAAAKGDAAMRRTVAAIFTAWALDSAFIGLTGIPTPWLWFIIVDTLAARVVLFHPRARLQGYVGACFVFQICVNLGYGVAYIRFGPGFERSLLRWEVIEALGYLKLMMIGGWALSDAVGRYLARWRRDRPMAASPHPRGASG